MRRVASVFVVLTVVAAAAVVAVAARAAGDATARPTIRLVDRYPFTVRGERFKASERVKVILSIESQSERSVLVTAAGGGTFTASFGEVTIRSCKAWGVRAIGAQGSRAVMKVLAPACMPDQAPAPAPARKND